LLYTHAYVDDGVVVGYGDDSLLKRVEANINSDKRVHNAREWIMHLLIEM